VSGLKNAHMASSNVYKKRIGVDRKARKFAEKHSFSRYLRPKQIHWKIAILCNRR